MRFVFTVEIEVERDSGKFASRDEIEQELHEAIDGADPEQIYGVGADGDSAYSVTEWSVSCNE